MWRNLFRQSFFAVFIPLLLVAGLFWLDELRGYRGEMTLLVLPKTQSAAHAAANLAALSREIPFAVAVSEMDDTLTNPLAGKTPTERRAAWERAADIHAVDGSDVIRISALGSDADAARHLAQAIVTELVRTASRYYNQKTEIDIRIVSDMVIVPSFTAWPRFLALSVLTAFCFTTLFFLVYGLIERWFPTKPRHPSERNDYVISSDTFKPRVPTYWTREEQPGRIEAEENSVSAPGVQDESVWPVETPERFAHAESSDDTDTRRGTDSRSIAEPVTFPEESESGALPEERVAVVSSSEEAWEAAQAVAPERTSAEPVYAGYVSHAEAPDNLPIVEGPITPLQGAQARLLKADIDAQAMALSAAHDPTVSEEAPRPQTHEPTPEEYRRRLNELLSGKM